MKFPTIFRGRVKNIPLSNCSQLNASADCNQRSIIPIPEVDVEKALLRGEINC